mgnify:CR=1 FL=1
MRAKCRFMPGRIGGVLLVLVMLCASPFPQAKPEDWIKSHPEIEGIYEMSIANAGTIVPT